MAADRLPTFSICIPNYNHGKYIGDTIQSVLDQTYPHFEIIIADNASTDNSVEVIKSFNDPRIRLIRNRCNIGFAPNLQRATSAAQNDFIDLLSSDDQMLPNALEVYAGIIQKLGARGTQTVLFSDVEDFTDTGKILSIERKASDGFYTDYLPPEDVEQESKGDISYSVYRGREVLRDSLSRLRTFAPFLSIVYPRALWEAIEGYNSVRTIGPDKHFNYKLLSLDPDVVYVPHILFRYRSYLSDNRKAQSLSLRQPIDDYLYTLEFSESDLGSLGLTKAQLVDTFVDTVCLKEGLRQIGQRNYTQAFRLFAFALSSYPGVALKMRKTYMLLALLIMGPVSYLLAPLLLSIYKSATAGKKPVTGALKAGL